MEIAVEFCDGTRRSRLDDALFHLADSGRSIRLLRGGVIAEDTRHVTPKRRARHPQRHERRD